MAAELRREYHRQYRQRQREQSPGKTAERDRRYWERKAAKLAANQNPTDNLSILTP